MYLHDIYLIGSLRNPEIRRIGEGIRKMGFRVFDDWASAAPDADDQWMSYEKSRGFSYGEALENHAAKHTFGFDKHHLDASAAAVLVAPAGKSAHLELGYMLGTGRPGFIYFPNGEPERWDVMYLFATAVCFGPAQLADALEALKPTNKPGRLVCDDCPRPAYCLRNGCVDAKGVR